MKIFNIGLPNKKASLNLSINAIVIVVLAMTLLGLGLGFIRNIFTGLEEQREEITEQVRSQILEDLRTGNKKLAFPATEVNIEKGNSKTLAMGVKNVKSIEELDFMVNVELLKAQVGGTTYSHDVDSGSWSPDLAEGITLDVNYFYNEGPFSLNVGESEVYSVRATGTGTAGVYMARIELLEKSAGGEYDSVYAEKTFFINII